MNTKKNGSWKRKDLLWGAGDGGHWRGPRRCEGLRNTKNQKIVWGKGGGEERKKIKRQSKKWNEEK